MRLAEQKFRAASEGNWKITRDERTSLPRTVFGGKTREYPGKPKAVAKAFLEEHKVFFGLERKHGTISHFETKELRQGVRLTFLQRYRNLEVVDGKIQVLVDADGRIIHTASTVWPVQDVNLKPKISPEKAIAIALVKDPPAGDVVWAKPALAIYPKSAGRLAYLLGYQFGQTVQPWEYAIDAVSGEVLEVRRRIKQETPPKQDPPRLRSSDKPEHKTFPRAIRLSTPPSKRPLPNLINAGAAVSVCDRQWELVGQFGETIVTEAGTPGDQYDVTIDLGVSSFGIDELGLQLEDIYGAGLQLLPCYEYTITYDWDLATWDSYNFNDGFNNTGYWDVFFVHINSVEFWWNIVFPSAIAEHQCDAIYNPLGLVDLPGPLWTFGGDLWDDTILCLNSGGFGITYTEPDTSKRVFLSVGLDTLITGDVDGEYPSWGTINVLVEADTTKLFDPNPVTTLNDGTLTDNNDANSATPCGGYTNVTLQRLNTPAAGQPWVLVGDYVAIASIAIPPACAGAGTAIAFTPPTSRSSIFPYLRDCDAFEGVMCYHHITQNQIYIQSLGFLNINNRQIQVDPHAISEDNSFYCPDGSGTGSLFFGDGGVDDGEDADVILHEYGHSMQDNQNVGAFGGAGGFGFGNETGAIGEGFGDYWACSSFNAQNVASGFNPAFFAEWDAPPIGLRQLNKNKIYPAAMVSQIHTDGEIWSGALWQIFQTLGKTLTDTRVLDSHFLVANNPTFADNAEAIMFSEHFDTGVNAPTIAGIFADRGIFQRLHVQSVTTGAAITVGTLDQLLDSNGTANFTRIYKYNESVILTAPATHNAIPFKRWKLDGTLQPLAQVTLNVTMTQTHTAIALYDSIEGDVNDDGAINVTDLLLLLGAWGPCPTPPTPCPADINGDGQVNVTDLLMLLGGWG